MFRPGLSAEQQRVVDGTAPNDFWAYWIDRHVNHGDLTEDGRPIIRCRAGHHVVNPMKDASRYRERGGGSSLGFGGREFTFETIDGRTLKSNDVWYQGTIPLAIRHLLPDNADEVTNWSHHQPWGSAEEATLASLSRFEHETLAVDFSYRETFEDHDGKKYLVTATDESRVVAPLAESQIWSSKIVNVMQPEDLPPNMQGFSESVHSGSRPVRMNVPGTSVALGRFPGDVEQAQSGWHTVMIDVDLDCRLVPSTTTGHWHLYIDKPMPWWRYRRLLKALKVAGIIEPGYYSASVRRQATHLRLPWVRKGASRTELEGDPF